jgi:hypothetical protein
MENFNGYAAPNQPTQESLTQETPSEVNNTVPGNIDASQKPAGTLFDSISYKHNEDVTMWLERMNVQDAIFGIISAAAYGHKKGIYNLLESEIVSKAIRLITMQPPKPANAAGMAKPTQPPSQVIVEGQNPVPTSESTTAPEPEIPTTPVQ